MADQDQVPQGAIPPKVTPFAKPEGVSPHTPVVPGTPRPITVSQRADSSADGLPPASSANPRSTTRVPVPEAVAAAPAASSAAPATVRLRPVAVSSMQPQHPPTPGANPLPDGPKPLSDVQMQATKSKTSRISLDSAIGVAPMAHMSVDKSEPKTIRLNRPTDLASQTNKTATTPIRQTSRIPDAALPNAATAQRAESASVTQKKTLKIKRPGVKEEGEATADGQAFPEGVQMTAISAVDFPRKQESPVFTAIAVFAASIAAVLLLLLTLCLGAHAVGPVAGRNSLAFIKGSEIPWPGRIVN
ncbi:MAG: hypothetical protein WCK89_04855 [bacterium]